MVEEGKSLDSRMEVWEPALQNLGRSPILGAYSQITGGTGVAQMHNTHLDIACSYGIPVLVMVCMLLFRWLNQRNQTYKSKTGLAYMLGLACAIIMGMGEAALFSGSLGLYILVGGFLLLGNQDAKIEPLVEFTS
jgi:membrane protein insertase Oxa1/YidC/SpoIIIJ